VRFVSASASTATGTWADEFQWERRSPRSSSPFLTMVLAFDRRSADRERLSKANVTSVGYATDVIREGQLSPESGRRQTARGASNGTVHQERVRKGGGLLDVTRPTRISPCRRKK
jgi:hypothetical protein